ncbi:DUF742 domain-containing protein [Actinocatenispora rupis]|uniref:DUF742 domain-containing protein n=1 Tax=Actinocatenispora rupis TaxID=519421 RepID=A0A8J3JB54_9ACTN|nr:DUF742 domain-containing protein [Actinocatenispora rupis]GID11523.1 hypothetical protein Aru02nite_24120 [Actinocatenispora rupis]
MSDLDDAPLNQAYSYLSKDMETGAVVRPTRRLPPETQVRTAGSLDWSEVQIEHASCIRLLSDSDWLSVAEVAARLQIPQGVIMELLCQLLDKRMVVRAAAPTTVQAAAGGEHRLPPKQVMEQLLVGLRAL